MLSKYEMFKRLVSSDKYWPIKYPVLLLPFQSPESLVITLRVYLETLLSTRSALCTTQQVTGREPTQTCQGYFTDALSNTGVLLFCNPSTHFPLSSVFHVQCHCTNGLGSNPMGLNFSRELIMLKKISSFQFSQEFMKSMVHFSNIIKALQLRSYAAKID